MFFDACKSLDADGNITILSQEQIDTFSTSTHTSSMSLIVTFINQASSAKVTVIGISVTDTHFCKTLSPFIKNRADELISLIKDATS